MNNTQANRAIALEIVRENSTQDPHLLGTMVEQALNEKDVKLGSLEQEVNMLNHALAYITSLYDEQDKKIQRLERNRHTADQIITGQQNKIRDLNYQLEAMASRLESLARTGER